MNKLFGLFILIFLQNTWAQAPDVNAIVGDYLKSAHNIEHKDIFTKAFDPQLEVQKNSGSFTTAFSIPLPANLLGINVLNFRYSSDEAKNYGFGVGWSINLPVILKKKSASSQAEYTIKGSWKTENLVKYAKDLSDFKPFLEKIGLSSEFETYAAEYEQNFNHYLRFQDGSWLVVDKNGKYYKFDPRGLLYEVGDRNGNKLLLSWQSDYLESISSVDWNAKFTYRTHKETFVTLYNELIEQEKLLEKVAVEVEGEIKTFLFSYEDTYLLKASQNGSKKAVFQGGYDEYKKFVPEILLVKENQKVVFDKSLTVPTLSDHDIGLHFYLDLNGDNFVDRIEYKTGEFFERVKKKLPSESSDFEERGGELIPLMSLSETQQKIQDLSLENEVMASNYSDEVGVARNRISHSGLNTKPFEVRLENDRRGNVLFYKPRIIPKQFQAIDLDGDGKSELVVCNGSFNLEQQRFDEDIKRNAIGSYLAGKSGDPSGEAEIATVYSIENHENAVSFLVYEDIDLSCHQDSLFFDINNDGLVDVVNGDEVYFGTRKLHRFERKNVKISKFADIESFKTISKGENQIYFASGEKKLKQLEGDQFVKFPLSNQRFSISNGSANAIENQSSHKMLSQILSPYGGKIEIDYDFYGKWFPRSISKLGNNLKEVTSYSYKTPLIDKSSGHFTGYSVVEVETSKGIENFKESFTRYLYSKDLEASRNFRVNREPLYGRLMMTVSGNRENVEAASGERHITKSDWSILKLNNFQSFVFAEKEQKEIIFDTTIVDNLIKKNEYKFNSNGQLVEVLERQILNGLDSSIGSLGFFDILSQTKYSFNTKTLTQYVNSKTLRDPKEEKEVSQRYTFDRYKNTYTQECKNGAYDCSQFFYDELGRLESIETSTGKSIQLGYLDASPHVISKSENDLVTKFERDRYFGLVSEVVKPTEEALTFKYNVDNELRVLERNGLEIIKVDGINERKFSLVSGMNREIVTLDDWGRIRQSHDVLPKEFSIDASNNSFDGTVYEKLKGSSPLTTNYYDEFKRLIKVIDFKNKITTDYVYSMNGMYVYRNDVLIKIENRDQIGLMSKQKYKGEAINLSYTLGTKLAALKSDEFKVKWGRTYNGKVEKSNIDSDKISVEFFREFSPDQLLESLYDEGSQKTYNVALNSYGQVESVECDWNGCNGIVENKLEYSNGLIIKEELFGNNIDQIVNYSYSKGQLVQRLAPEVNINLSYDQYGLIKSKNINHLSYEVEGDYKGRIFSLKPFIQNFAYDNEGKLSRIEYSEKLNMNFQYDGDRLRNVGILEDGNEKELLAYRYNNLGLIEKMEQNITSQSSESIDYDANLKVLGLNTKADYHRNKNGQVASLGERRLGYHFNNLTSFDEFKFNYDHMHSLLFAKKSGKTVFERIDSDTFLVNTKLVHALRFGAKIVGVFIDSAFYPVLTNHQNSVVAMFDPNGEILWERKYSLTGVKSLIYVKDENAQKLEALTVFSFSDLIEIPGVEGIYWSKTRAYSPKVGEWLSLDNEVIWNPDSLLSKDGNWKPYTYVDNDPVNFVDPSGGATEAVFVGYMNAGLVDLGHYTKSKALSLYEVLLGIESSQLTGGGIKPSYNAGLMKFSSRFGFDMNKGVEAFAEAGFSLGSLKGAGQFGYSNGGLRAVARVDRKSGSFSTGYSIGTTENVRGKFDLDKIASLQYNSDYSGRIDFALGNYSGIDWSGYVNIGLSDESYQHFEEAERFDEWAISGMPYGGDAW